MTSPTEEPHGLSRGLSRGLSMEVAGEGAQLSGLLVDLYELTMAQSYVDEGMEELATFSLFVRHLPTERGYLIAAGLEDVLQYLEGLVFTADELAFLEETGLFTVRLLKRLADLRFTGTVRALPEGTLCFADEPILEVTAPIPEAQLVETVVINEIQLQTMIATKAARCATVAGGHSLVDFALRRTQGPATGVKVARACYLGGFDATSNVLAGRVHGIPLAGTMAHSYVQAFPSELEAFRAYVRAYPGSAVLLLDTYDSLEGARTAVVVGRELAAQGYRLRGVRLDSGDLIGLSRAVREILDEGGLRETTIFASGNLDEYAVERAVAAAAPIDGFGIGTRIGVSEDAPYLELAYKLVSYAGRPTLKLSADKASVPGAKQVWRAAPDGVMRGDWLGLANEADPDESTPLLLDVMRDGQRLSPPESLAAVRARVQAQLTSLPTEYRQLRGPATYPVRSTPGLIALERKVRGQTRPLVGRGEAAR